MSSLIEIKSLSKSYVHGKKDVHALCNISFTIEKGDIYGIIGLSGAGKSTLIRCLSSLVTPTEGKILFHGENIFEMGKSSLRSFRKRIGMVFQHFNLLSSRTVADNIAYPLELSQMSKEKQRERVDELLSLVGLKEKKDAYPCQLSGGEKQRVGIARALASHPEVLFCDEATSALDPKTTREILSLLKDINQKLGVSIVLITHEMEVIKQICNKVAVMENGKIVEEGLVNNVFADPKHNITRQFLQKTIHDIPAEFFQTASPERKLLKLSFKGVITKEPIISELVRRFDVNANIVLGWIDRLQSCSVGILVIELTGSQKSLEKALEYLLEKNVHYEVIENEL